MELHVIIEPEREIVVLLDNEMRIVKPVYNYLKYLKQKGSAVNTLKAKGSDLKIFWQFLYENGYDYDKVTPNMIAKFIDYLRKGNENSIRNDIESARTDRTINRILSTVRMFYQYQSDIQAVDNAMSVLHQAKLDNKTSQSIFKIKESKRMTRLVTEDEINLFLSKLSKRRDILLYKVLYLTGATIQEVLDLKIEDIPAPDLSKSVGIFQQIKSKGKTRDLYAPMSLIVELNAFIFEERNLIKTEHSYLFVSEQERQKGKQLTYRSAYEKLKRVQDEIGIFFSFHDLRHTFYSNLVQQGMPTSIVAHIMGCKYISTSLKDTYVSNSFIQELSSYWQHSSLVGSIIAAK